jgi:hypothetical protein
MNKLFSGSGALALVALLACGGGGGGSTPPAAPVTASSLVYTDPATGTYKLMKKPASSGAHMIFDLMGPATASRDGQDARFIPILTVFRKPGYYPVI